MSAHKYARGQPDIQNEVLMMHSDSSSEYYLNNIKEN